MTRPHPSAWSTPGRGGAGRPAAAALIAAIGALALLACTGGPGASAPSSPASTSPVSTISGPATPAPATPAPATSAPPAPAASAPAPATAARPAPMRTAPAPQPRADEPAGRSVSVQDGDSFVLQAADGSRLRVRIAAIDAPEKGQPFAEASRRNLAELLQGRQLRLRVTGEDRYGRVVASVYAGGRDAGLAQLRAGLAWHYRSYQSEQSARARRDYAAAEAQARGAGLGLWRDADPVPPWLHREAQRSRNDRAKP